MTATAAGPDGTATEERTFIEAALTLERLQVHSVNIRVEGVSPLILHAWADKAIAALPGGGGPKVQPKKTPRKPDEDFEAARYRLNKTTDGVRAASFRGAIVGAARHFEGISMTLLKQSLFVVGSGPQQLLPIISGEPTRFLDPVRFGMSSTDVHPRPMYDPWAVIIPIEYVASTITLESVYALVDAAGLGGVGEWRPSAPKSLTGSYGRFRVSVEDK